MMKNEKFLLKERPPTDEECNFILELIRKEGREGKKWNQNKVKHKNKKKNLE